MKFFILVIVAILSTYFPVEAKNLGNADAPIGGTFYNNLSGEPINLHPLKNQDAYSSDVTAYVFDSLLSRNIETFEIEPGLAEKYMVAKDGKSITFTIREGVKFHDGTPLTIEDIQFSFNAIFDDKLSEPMYRMYFENFEKAEILSPKEIKFHIKNKYFGNLEAVGLSMTILPKAHYSKVDKKLNKNMIGSGPYMQEKYEQGKFIILKRNPNWWGHNLAPFKGFNKFEKIHFRFVKDDNAELEMFKKGDFDYIGLTPEQFEKKTSGDIWGSKVIKKQVENSGRKNTGFVGLNLRRPIFQDKKVRQALSELLNRPFLIEKFVYNKALPATGPWYQQNPYADKSAKPFKFDLANAKKLLKEAGWADTNKDGVLDKVMNGKSVDFRFSIVNGGGDWEKYLTVYREDLKKAGIDMSVKVVEWNALQKMMDDGSFDAVALAWRDSIEVDPKQVWHSDSIRKGGSNFIAYSNAEVDNLIMQARAELDRNKRIKLLNKVYRKIADDYPYVFLWNGKYSFYAHNKRIQQVQPTYKYGVGIGTWWIKE